jgi:hypothetical protein
MKRVFLSFALLCTLHSAGFASSCPMPAVIDFCVAGGADVDRLRTLAQRPGWAMDGQSDHVELPLPRSGSFTATSPEKFFFAVIYQDYGTFASVTCSFDPMTSTGALGGMPSCSEEEEAAFEAALRGAGLGEVSKQTGASGYSIMARAQSSWMRAAVSPARPMVSIWTDSHAVKP